MIEMPPYFKHKTTVGKDMTVTRSQMKVLWYLNRGAICETWITSFPIARVWTKTTAFPVGVQTIKSMYRKKLLKKGKVVKDDKGRMTTRWHISHKGEKIMEEYQ